MVCLEPQPVAASYQNEVATLLGSLFSDGLQNGDCARDRGLNGGRVARGRFWGLLQLLDDDNRRLQRVRDLIESSRRRVWLSAMLTPPPSVPTALLIDQFETPISAGLADDSVEQAPGASGSWIEPAQSRLNLVRHERRMRSGESGAFTAGPDLAAGRQPSEAGISTIPYLRGFEHA
jgi:hypothetical protein